MLDPTRFELGLELRPRYQPNIRQLRRREGSRLEASGRDDVPEVSPRIGYDSTKAVDHILRNTCGPILALAQHGVCTPFDRLLSKYVNFHLAAHRRNCFFDLD